MNQNVCSILLKQSCLNLQKLFHNSGIHLANHYETLKLERNCTSKEIRDSFITLSKKNHPDVNKNAKAHKEFLKIQEAYNVLSKKESRLSYDLSLLNPYYGYDKHTTNVRTHQERNGEKMGNSWDDPFIYHSRVRSQDTQYETPPYYGIRGINKVSNGTVALFIIMIAFASFVGQMIVINEKNVRPWDKEWQEKRNKH